MKRSPNFRPNRYLTTGLCLNIIYMCTTQPAEPLAPFVLNLLSFLEGLGAVLMLVGLLHTTPKGRALLDQVCRWKHDTFGKGAV